MIRKIINFIASLVQISLLIFVVVIYYLSTRKMGVMRSLTYRNDVWEQQGLRQYLVLGLIIVTILFAIGSFINRRHYRRFKVSITFMVVSIMCSIFTIYFNDTLIRAYYVLSIGALAILTIELVKVNFIYKRSKQQGLI